MEQTEYMYGGKVVRTFDANGYQIKLEEFPPYGFGDGSVSSIQRWKNAVDEHGNMVKIEQFDDVNHLSSIIENSYEYY